MKYTVGWRYLENKREKVYDARTFYEAKKAFLDERIPGWNQYWTVKEALQGVIARCPEKEDKRLKAPIPDDFPLKDFLDKEAPAC